MINDVEKFLQKYNLSDKTLIVGFSGGWDSLCLLDVLVKLSKKYSFKVVAAHLNHNWRGEEALMEQERCRNFANVYGIEFLSETLPDNVKASENTAREARYKFFEKCVKKYNNACVLTAHNANDNAETILYRIVKGTGIAGMCGISEHVIINGIDVFRPILNCYRIDIENYCKNNNLLPNNDSSNTSTVYKRNFIRHKIIPLMKEINPNVEQSLNKLIIYAKNTEDFIEKLISEAFEDNKIIYQKYIKMPDLKTDIVHKFFVQNNLDYDRKKILEAVEFLDNEQNKLKKYSLTKDLWLKFDGKYIYTVTKNIPITGEITVCSEGCYDTPLGGKFELLEYTQEKEFPKENSCEAVVDLSGIEFPLTLRTRRDGDIIQPFGMNGKMKLKKYLISKKIPQEQRDNILLLTKNNDILWVVGVGISNKLRVAKLPTSVLKYNHY